MPLGLYISVPFCRTKCTFCNFASGVVSPAVYNRYTDRLCEDISRAASLAESLGGSFDRRVDSIYLGGGTPTMLQPAQLERIFAAVRSQFAVHPDAEVTVECAPGTLNPDMLEALLRCGVNRVSLGVQSFVDQEARSVGRLHTRTIVLDDISRLRGAGIKNISLDLIAGLPHQTAESWRDSLEETMASGVPHVSVYMLEVDEDSRLGNELLAGGSRYHAHFVPDEDATSDFYLEACAAFEAAGLQQYEISNFARGPVAPDSLPRWHSRHNLKYWTRQPYLGFGVDAHSMLPGRAPSLDAIRFATPDNLEQYLASTRHTITPVTPAEAFEEHLFLGLRLNRGIQLDDLPISADQDDTSAPLNEAIAELQQEGLLQVAEGWIRLTARGRLLSNEVFARFVGTTNYQAA